MTQHSSFQPVTAYAIDTLARLDRLISGFVDELGNLGALVAIDVDGVGRVTFTAGHSNLEKSREVQPGDVFQIGSQSKTITAMTLVLMARDGLVELDSPVVKYVSLPVDQRITVRHLLMNTCGLGEYTFALFTRFDPRIHYSPRDLVALALPQGQIFDPGERFDYCNTAWVIAAMVIEAIAGKPYGDAVGDRIVEPLALRNAGFGGIIPNGEPMRGYMTIATASEPVDTSELLSWGFGAGDGIASADDMLTIFSSLMRKDSPIGLSLQDLAGETMKPCAAPYFPVSFGTEYGLGLERREWAGSEVWGHPGSTGACRTASWIDAARGVSVTTAMTVHVGMPGPGDDIRYPRAQLFSMVLNGAYALAADRK